MDLETNSRTCRVPSSTRNHSDGVFVVSSPTRGGVSPDFVFIFPRSREILLGRISPDCLKCLLKVRLITPADREVTCFSSPTTNRVHIAFCTRLHAWAGVPKRAGSFMKSIAGAAFPPELRTVFPDFLRFGFLSSGGEIGVTSIISLSAALLLSETILFGGVIKFAS